MKRMTQILSLGLLLSVSSVALAGQNNDRNSHDGYYDNSSRQHHNARQNDHYNNRHNDRDDRRQYSKHSHGNRHYVENKRHAHQHSQHGRYCYDWHPRGYVAPRMRYGYNRPGLVIVYQPSAGLYINSGH
jgi:hypothetical protein